MAATAPSRVSASTVEGAGYGGTTAGGWTCGPVGRTNYGGVGARVRVNEKEARFGGRGFTGEVAAAAEREATVITRCDETCSAAEVRGPPTATMGGGHVRAGYQWEHVGVEAGATVFQGWDSAGDRVPTTAVLPEAELSLGSHDEGRGLVGFGTPLVTMQRRPSLYAGADVPAGNVDVEARFGATRAGPALGDSAAARADVAVLVPVTGSLRFRLGASGSTNDEGEGAEGSVGLRGSL